jgi:hypothetical protein
MKEFKNIETFDKFITECFHTADGTPIGCRSHAQTYYGSC